MNTTTSNTSTNAAAQYFYGWVGELTTHTVYLPLSGIVKIELSDFGQQNDVLTVGGQVVARGSRAAAWYQAAPASISA